MQRTVKLPYGPANTIRPSSSAIICASQNAYILDLESQEQHSTFPASTNSVHTIIDSASKASQAIRFLTVGEKDRFISVFQADSTTLIGSLRTENEILTLDYCATPDHLDTHDATRDSSVKKLRPYEAVVVVNKDGALELFSEPFIFGSTSSTEDARGAKARMQKRSRPREALVRVRRPDKTSSIVPIINASFRGNDIAIAWTEGGINPVFEHVPWRDEASGDLLLKDITDIVKSKGNGGIGAVVINGVKDMGRSHIDESHTVVANGRDVEEMSMVDEPSMVIEISSAEESDSDDEVPTRALGKQEANAKKDHEDVDMEDVNAPEALAEAKDNLNKQSEERDEPSFGELLRANAPEPVDIQASFVDPNAQSLVATGDRSLQQLPSGMSLGTVLTQSLRTNDTDLLESCFHVKDLPMVRATIERLESSFAVILLQRLAERLHSRPGRAGSLMVWVQWTLVAHGGYLAGQPELMKKLASLHRVVRDRANSLQALLSLKGKLDMLEAQMNLRKSMQARSRAAIALDEDDEEGVIYVEGQETTATPRPSQGGPTPQRKAKSAEDDDDDDEAGISDADSKSEEENSEAEEMPNGIAAASEDESSNSDEAGLFDNEASSTDNDSASEGESINGDIDHDSVDSFDSSDADASPPPKRPAKSALSNGIKPRK